MPSIIEKIYQSGRGSVISTKSKATVFSPVDVVYLRDRIGIADKAKANAKDNLPSSGSNTFDSVESEIKSAANDALREYVDEYDAQIEAYRTRSLNSLKILQDFSIVNKFKATLGDLKALVNEKKGPLYNKEETLKSLVNTILRFRRNHGLLERTPELGNRAKMASKIAVSGLLEILLTAGLIRDSGDLFTVIVVALVFFTLNILIVFLLFSRFAKNINAIKNGKIDYIKRAMGYAVTLMYLLLYTLPLNLVFAHLRSVSSDVERLLAENPDSYLQAFGSLGETALQQFSANGFYLPDVYSYALFLLGLLLSLYVFIQGYEFDDKYPGYGKLKRMYDEEFDSYSDEIEDTITVFSENRDEGIEQAEEYVKILNDSYKHLPDLNENAAALRLRFDQAFEALNVNLQVLIQEYREQNTRHRTTDAPKHFNEPCTIAPPTLQSYSFEKPVYPDLLVSNIEAHRDAVFTLFDESISEVKDLRKVLDNAYPFSVERSDNDA